MTMKWYTAAVVLAVCGAVAATAVGQVPEPPTLPAAPPEATPYEEYLDTGSNLPARDLLVEMNDVYDAIKKQYKLHNYTKMTKRTRDLRNMAKTLRDKSRQTPDPTAFYGAADQLRVWSVNLRSATEKRNGDEMYKALKRLANRFNDCYAVLGEPQRVSEGARYDPPKAILRGNTGAARR